MFTEANVLAFGVHMYKVRVQPNVSLCKYDVRHICTSNPNPGFGLQATRMCGVRMVRPPKAARSANSGTAPSTKDITVVRTTKFNANLTKLGFCENRNQHQNSNSKLANNGTWGTAARVRASYRMTAGTPSVVHLCTVRELSLSLLSVIGQSNPRFANRLRECSSTSAT